MQLTILQCTGQPHTRARSSPTARRLKVTSYGFKDTEQGPTGGCPRKDTDPHPAPLCMGL